MSAARPVRRWPARLLRADQACALLPGRTVVRWSLVPGPAREGHQPTTTREENRWKHSSPHRNPAGARGRRGVQRGAESWRSAPWGRWRLSTVRRVLRVIGSLMTSRAWLGGFALMLTGLACQTIALTFKRVSVVGPRSGSCSYRALPAGAAGATLRGGETWCVAAMRRRRGPPAGHERNRARRTGAVPARDGWRRSWVPSTVRRPRGALRAPPAGHRGGRVWASGGGCAPGSAALAVKPL